GVARDGNWMDQNADGRRIELETDLNPTDAYSAPRPLNGVPFREAPNYTPNAPFDPLTLPLSIPGPFVFSSNIPGRAQSQDNLVTGSAVSSFDVVFDRNMAPASFTPQQVLRVQGGQGVLNGPFGVTQIDGRTFRLSFPTQTLSGTYTFSLGSAIRSV